MNILKATWSPFENTPWVFPLLTQFSDYRKTFFDHVANEVSKWTNSSDVVFVADYPNRYFENFMPTELKNITISIVSGEILVEQMGKPNVTISNKNELSLHSFIMEGRSHRITGGNYHKIHNINNFPSCYMYTYTNSTVDNSKSDTSAEQETNYSDFISQNFQDLSDFFQEKYDVFTRGLLLMMNAYLDVFLEVPMVVRKRILD